MRSAQGPPPDGEYAPRLYQIDPRQQRLGHGAMQSMTHQRHADAGRRLEAADVGSGEIMLAVALGDTGLVQAVHEAHRQIEGFFEMHRVEPVRRGAVDADEDIRG
ncbi:MAG: hypothetical protein IPM01_28330 [Burkholderiaceae bacterium]|nr:hypothetical protein [Burkholderiaceae bacterium]